MIVYSNSALRQTAEIMEGLQSEIEQLCADLATAQAENERLRGALRKARKFIDDSGPDWWTAKQYMLADIDATLAEKE